MAASNEQYLIEAVYPTDASHRCGGLNQTGMASTKKEQRLGEHSRSNARAIGRHQKNLDLVHELVGSAPTTTSYQRTTDDDTLQAKGLTV